MNVIDAVERIQRKHHEVVLRICCDDRVDFNTRNWAMREEYLSKIRGNPGMILGRVSRDQMISCILPETDIYLLPTYQEAFGFAVVEAMAYGIPVISTRHRAIPEMDQDGVSGFLIDVKRYDLDAMFKGYVVDEIPDGFRTYVTGSLTEYLLQLIESPSLRRSMGVAGMQIARSKFSFEERNRKMRQIYEDAMS